MAGEVWKGGLGCWTYPYHFFRWVQPQASTLTKLKEGGKMSTYLENFDYTLFIIGDIDSFEYFAVFAPA